MKSPAAPAAAAHIRTSPEPPADHDSRIGRAIRVPRKGVARPPTRTSAPRMRNTTGARDFPAAPSRTAPTATRMAAAR